MHATLQKEAERGPDAGRLGERVNERMERG